MELCNHGRNHAEGSGGGPLGGLLGGEEAVLRDAARERAVMDAGVPYTLVRIGPLRSVPAGTGGPRLVQVRPQAAGHIFSSTYTLLACFARPPKFASA